MQHNITFRLLKEKYEKSESLNFVRYLYKLGLCQNG